MHFTKSCDISQLKNVIRHGHYGPNQHNLIGHWQELNQILGKDLQTTPKIFEKER
jgi:hypothetical protein